MNRMRTREEVEDLAVQAIRTHGSVVNAIGVKSALPTLTGDVLCQLEKMLIKHPADLLKVRCGTRLREPGTRIRFVMTTLGILVNIDTGHMLNSHNAPFPLEIYRYGRR